MLQQITINSYHTSKLNVCMDNYTLHSPIETMIIIKLDSVGPSQAGIKMLISLLQSTKTMIIYLNLVIYP